MTSIDTVPTAVGTARVVERAPDRFRVVIEDAETGGTRFAVVADLFMPEPGQFVDFDPEGRDMLKLLPKDGSGFPDLGIEAADASVGTTDPTVVAADHASVLRRAVHVAAARAFDLAAERTGPEPSPEHSPARPGR